MANKPTPVPTPSSKKKPSGGVSGSWATPVYKPPTPTPVPTPSWRPTPTPAPKPGVVPGSNNNGGNNGGGGGGGGGGGNVITHDDAMRLGYDVNNLPPGVSLADEGGGGDNYDEQMRQAAESEYNSTMDYLNGVESWLRGQYGDATNSINSSANINTQSLNDQLGVYNKETSLNKADAFKRREDAISSAQRMYQELQQASKQRFGGSTSAGEASSELLGAEQMRQQGSTMDTYNSYVDQQNLSSEKVQKEYATALTTIASNAENARKTALAEFTNKMLEISRAKGAAASNRDQRKLDALYELRNKQYEINMQEKQFQQQIEAARETARLNIDTQRNTEAQSFAGLTQKFNIKPETQYTIGNTSFTTNSAPVYVGKIQKYVIGKDAKGRTVYWDPATDNFDFGWTQYDASGNPSQQTQQQYGF
jgi:hypothetical protein